jgi:beta-galactosidase
MSNTTRQCLLFDADWAFALGDVCGAEQASLDDSAWTRLNLPHDWSVAGPFREDAPSGFGGGYLPTGLAWYRKAFCLAEAEQGRRVRLAFDGVYKNAEVWVNGHRLAFRGLCLAIIQATPRAGQISITLSTPGWPAQRVIVETCPSL